MGPSGSPMTRCLHHVHRPGDWMCRCPTRAVAQKPNVGKTPCDTGSSMRGLTGSQTRVWFMCQHMHVMSLELPPQQWPSICMCPQLRCIIQGPSEPANGSLEGAQISGSSASPPYLNIDVRSPRLGILNPLRCWCALFVLHQCYGFSFGRAWLRCPMTDPENVPQVW